MLSLHCLSINYAFVYHLPAYQHPSSIDRKNKRTDSEEESIIVMVFPCGE